MIFVYTACPVCGCEDIYKDAQGNEQCHGCDNPFFMFIPSSDFIVDDDHQSWERTYD